MTHKLLTSITVNVCLAIPAVAIAPYRDARSYWPVILFAGALCIFCKRRAIGGWLLFFYIAVYLGAVVAAISAVRHMEGMPPQSFAASEHYTLLKWVVTQRIVLTLVAAVIATFLLFARTLAMLNLLRWVMVARIAVGLASLFAYVDFPDEIRSTFMGLLALISWLAYLLLSRRVKHVFVLNDWDTAMQRTP